MAIFVVAAIWPARREARIARRAILAVFAVLFAGATIYAGTKFFQVCYPEDTVASMLVDYRSGAALKACTSTSRPRAISASSPQAFPMPAWSAIAGAVLGKPDPDDPDANPVWTPDQGSCQATFKWMTAPRPIPNTALFAPRCLMPAILVLRLLSYPAWASAGQRPALDSTCRTRHDGLIAVPVPQGPVLITVDWTTSPGDVAGRWITILSALLLIALSLSELRKRRSRLT